MGTFEVPIDHSWEEHPHYEKGFPKIPKEITDLGVFAPFVYVARMFWHLMSKKKKYGGWLKAEVFDKNGLEITIDSDIPSWSRTWIIVCVLCSYNRFNYKSIHGVWIR